MKTIKQLMKDPTVDAGSDTWDEIENGLYAVAKLCYDNGLTRREAHDLYDEQFALVGTEKVKAIRVAKTDQK